MPNDNKQCEHVYPNNERCTDPIGWRIEVMWGEVGKMDFSCHHHLGRNVNSVASGATRITITPIVVPCGYTVYFSLPGSDELHRLDCTSNDGHDGRHTFVITDPMMTTGKHDHLIREQALGGSQIVAAESSLDDGSEPAGLSKALRKRVIPLTRK